MQNSPLLDIEVSPITQLSAANHKTYLAGVIPTSDLLCFIDGSCRPNPGEMAVGVYMEYTEIPIIRKAFPGGYGTNNEAEFCALLQAIKILKAMELSNHAALSGSIAIMSDSQMLVNAFKGDNKLKEGRLKTRLAEIEILKNDLAAKFDIFWIPRKLNSAAHFLSVDEEIELKKLS